MTDRRTLLLTNPLLTGADIIDMQRSIGCDPSGVFDYETESAVEVFQERHGLKVDGICGPKTWAVIDALGQPETGSVYACTTTNKTLRITNDVALWLMRMIVGEGGVKCSTHKTASLCWAIVNRWFLWPGARHYSNFVEMMRAFSQPINPRWMSGGDLAEKYKGKGPASPARLDRRAKICSMDKRIPSAIRENVVRFSAGVLPYPELSIEKKRISNWASLKSAPSKYPWGVDIDGDWFFEDENLRDGEVIVK